MIIDGDNKSWGKVWFEEVMLMAFKKLEEPGPHPGPPGIYTCDDFPQFWEYVETLYQSGLSPISPTNSVTSSSRSDNDTTKTRSPSSQTSETSSISPIDKSLPLNGRKDLDKSESNGKENTNGRKKKKKKKNDKSNEKETTTSTTSNQQTQPSSSTIKKRVSFSDRVELLPNENKILSKNEIDSINSDTKNTNHNQNNNSKNNDDEDVDDIEEISTADMKELPVPPNLIPGVKVFEVNQSKSKKLKQKEMNSSIPFAWIKELGIGAICIALLAVLMVVLGIGPFGSK